MHLIEGAKWSDGEPFDTEDIEFYYNDVVEGPRSDPAEWAPRPTPIRTASTKVIDDYTFTLTFTTAFPESVLYNMAYGNFCPGPAIS